MEIQERSVAFNNYDDDMQSETDLQRQKKPKKLEINQGHIYKMTNNYEKLSC